MLARAGQFYFGEAGQFYVGANTYGRWTDASSFELIGDLVDELVAAGGVYARELPTGGVRVDIPLTPQTMSRRI